MDQENQSEQPAVGQTPEPSVQPEQPNPNLSGSDPSAPLVSTPTEKPAGGNKKALIIAAVVVAMLVLGAVLVFATKGDKADDSSSHESSSSASDTTSSSSDSSSESSSTPQSGEVSVDIKDFAYSPEKITVKKGTKVTWTNEDTAGHTVTSDDDSPQKGLDSDTLSKGKSYSFTFDTVGVYNYHCTPHRNMIGSIEVVE